MHFSLITATTLSRLKNVDLLNVVIENHQGFEKTYYLILFISGEVGHCKTLQKLLSSRTDESH